MKRKIAFVFAVTSLVLFLCLPTWAEDPPPCLGEWWMDQSDPMDIAADTFGNFYVTDSANHRVVKFDTNGNILLTWGTFGTGDGQFTAPRGIAVDSANFIYVGDPGTELVQKFDANGSFIDSWWASSAPYGLTVDQDDNIWVTADSKIRKFDGSGTKLLEWGTYGSEPGQIKFARGVAVAPDGSVFVAEQTNWRVSKFDGNGNFIHILPAGGWDVVVDSAGNAYVGDDTSIIKFDSAGTLLTQWTGCDIGLGYFGWIRGLGIDSRGIIYVAQWGNHHVTKFGSAVPSMSCTGFQPPMASGPVTARGNRALPLKAQLFDANGAEMTDLDLAARPVLQVMFQSASGRTAVDVTNDALPAGFGTEGNEFEYNLVDLVWQYNLKTKDHTAAGTYTITMVSGDDAEYVIVPTCEAAFEREE